MLKIRPLTLNELKVDVLDQEKVIHLEKEYIYLADAVQMPEFPVDVVFTWVDDGDGEWRGKLQKYKEETEAPSISTVAERFCNSNELKYSVRAVLKYLPWVRQIFIVTDEQRHPDVLESEKIKYISHKQIIDKKYLPTFNSHVIEAHLHRIPGLAEHFIYFNDDVFVAQTLEKEHFFKKNGLASIFVNKKIVQNDRGDTPTTWAASNAQRLLKKQFDCEVKNHLIHTYIPLRKSDFEWAWSLFEKEIDGFLGQRFRSRQDINLATFLVPWMSFLDSRATPALDICYYFNHRSAGAKTHWEWLARQDNLPHSFCANDYQGGSNIVRSEALEVKLESFYEEKN